MKHAGALLGGDVHQRAELLDLVFDGLKLSHALHAIGSPGPAKKFDDYGAVLEHFAQNENFGTVRRRECEIGYARAHTHGGISHHSARVERVPGAGNN
jgi:hypothetical protein